MLEGRTCSHFTLLSKGCSSRTPTPGFTCQPESWGGRSQRQHQVCVQRDTARVHCLQVLPSAHIQQISVISTFSSAHTSLNMSIIHIFSLSFKHQLRECNIKLFLSPTGYHMEKGRKYPAATYKSTCHASFWQGSSYLQCILRAANTHSSAVLLRGTWSQVST